jgi:hypothetical protein
MRTLESNLVEENQMKNKKRLSNIVLYLALLSSTSAHQSDR